MEYMSYHTHTILYTEQIYHSSPVFGEVGGRGNGKVLIVHTVVQWLVYTARKQSGIQPSKKINKLSPLPDAFNYIQSVVSFLKSCLAKKCRIVARIFSSLAS